MAIPTQPFAVENFLKANPQVKREIIKRLENGDSTQELIKYLKTIKWPGVLNRTAVSAMVSSNFKQANEKFLLDTGYTQAQINKMSPGKKANLKTKIKNYKNILVPHLKKYDGSIGSIFLKDVRKNQQLNNQLNKQFKNETDPTLLKFIEKETKKKNFKAKTVQSGMKNFTASGEADKLRKEGSLVSRKRAAAPIAKLWAEGEKWIADNAPIYDDPNKMRIDFIKKFGKNHPLITGVKTGYDPTRPNVLGTGFSDDFIRDVLGSPKGMKLDKPAIKNIFNAAIYNFNDDVRLSILNKIKEMYEAGPAPTRYQARQEFNNPLFKKYNLNERIDGPIGRLIKIDLDKKVYEGLQKLRSPRMDTIEHIKWLADAVSPQYKKMFNETVKALQFAQQKQWPQAKKQFNISQNINFEHKIPQRLIDKGYADPIEYIKVVPTQRGFNEVKFRTFDRPLTNYITAYEKADPEDKAKWLKKMRGLRDRFNKKFGNYLGDVKINEVDGKIKLQSLGEAVTQDTDLVSSLRAALKQEKGRIPQQFLKGIKENLISRATQGGLICSIFGKASGLGKASGGSVGDGCARQMELAFDNAPEQTLNDIGKLNDPKLKTFAQRALSLFPKLGTPGKIVAGVAAGVGTIGALTYNKELGEFVNPLNDDKAGQGTLTEWIKENPVKTVAGTSLGFSAQEIPGAYKKARELGRGRTRSALGITGALRPVLTTFGTPAMTALFEVPFSAKRLEEGETMTDVLTDPLGPALGLTFMEPLSKGAGVIRDAPKRTMAEGLRNYFNLQNVGQARPGVTSKILRMGMSPRMIAGASRFLGLPGLALSLGLTGYDAYKNYQNQEGMIYNFFNRDE